MVRVKLRWYIYYYNYAESNAFYGIRKKKMGGKKLRYYESEVREYLEFSLEGR